MTELQSEWGTYKVNRGEVECVIILTKWIDLRSDETYVQYYKAFGTSSHKKAAV